MFGLRIYARYLTNLVKLSYHQRRLSNEFMPDDAFYHADKIRELAGETKEIARKLGRGTQRFENLEHTTADL